MIELMHKTPSYKKKSFLKISNVFSQLKALNSLVKFLAISTYMHVYTDFKSSQHFINQYTRTSWFSVEVANVHLSQ